MCLKVLLRHGVHVVAALFFGLFAIQAVAQSSSSVTVNGVNITIVGGQAQSISTTSDGAEILFDGRRILISGNSISVDGSSISGDAFSSVTLDASGSSLKIFSDGTLRMELSSKRTAQNDEGTQLNDLGVAYYRGDGVEQSYDIAIQKFVEAVECCAHGRAANNLAITFWSGIGNIPANRSEALKYAPLAAENGFQESQYYIGVALLEGIETAQDPQAALGYFEQAADQGHTDAMVSLGKLYEDGVHVPKDVVEAARRFKTAADNGNALGAMNVAFSYWTGEGVEESATTALAYAKQGAEGDYLGAYFLLGIIYDFGGDGVPENNQLAIEYYEKAAIHDHSAAALNLALMYKEGEGTEKDLDEALRWMRKANELGHEKAPAQLAEIEAELASLARPAPAPEASIYWYAIGRQRFGPTTLSNLKEVLASGQIGLDSYVWRQGLADWVFARALPELVQQ